MSKSYNGVKRVTSYYVFLLIVWGCYRLLFQLPETVESFVLKPIVWLLPLLWLLKKENKSISSLGINSNKIFSTIYLSLILGVIFSFEGLFVNYLKYGSLEFRAFVGQSSFFVLMFSTLATAISEELAFRGYIFNRLLDISRNEWSANLITSIGWSIIHLPIAVLDWQLSFYSLSIYVFLLFLFSFAACFVFARTKNILAPILLHLFWQWPIILFR